MKKPKNLPKKTATVTTHCCHICLLLAIANDLAIFRIYFELPSVIVSAAPTLALRSAADGLLWTVGRTQKSTLTVDTAAVLGHVDSSEIFTRRISEKIIKRQATCKFRNQYRVPTASLPAGFWWITGSVQHRPEWLRFSLALTQNASPSLPAPHRGDAYALRTHVLSGRHFLKPRFVCAR